MFTFYELDRTGLTNRLRSANVMVVPFRTTREGVALMAPETTARTPVTHDEITTVMTTDGYTPDTLGMIAHRVHLFRRLPNGHHDPKVSAGNTLKALTEMAEAGTVVTGKGADNPTADNPALNIGTPYPKRNVTYYTLATLAEQFRRDRDAKAERIATIKGYHEDTRDAVIEALSAGGAPQVAVLLTRDQAMWLGDFLVPARGRA